MRDLVRDMPFGKAADAADDRFAAFVRRQSRFVYRVAWGMLRHVQDAEDIVQETFLRVHRAREWDQLEDERAYLARIAWRLAADRLRTYRREVEPVDVVSGAVGPEAGAVATDWNRRITQLIDALPEELRQPLVLAGVEEMTSKEIAEVMGIPEGTVRTRIMRARSLLKERMAGLMEKRHG